MTKDRIETLKQAAKAGRFAALAGKKLRWPAYLKGRPRLIKAWLNAWTKGNALRLKRLKESRAKRKATKKIVAKPVRYKPTIRKIEKPMRRTKKWSFLTVDVNSYSREAKLLSATMWQALRDYDRSKAV